MSTVLRIASGEWRYWLRSRLAPAVVLLFAAILVFISLSSALRIQAETSARTHYQAHAEETFLAQPDRHPHRMVHYGHYVFRAPTPLAIFDPGLDSVTGQAMFLEGHRQNSATFSASVASADLGGLSKLTPAMIYQVFAPLLIILLGHSALIREREAGTLASLLAQGISGRALLGGKAIALMCFLGLLLAPLIVSALLAVTKGESLLAAVSIMGVYFAYLLVWLGLTLLVSAVVNKRATGIAILASLWLALTLVLPAVAVSAVSSNVPLAGKIETEMDMLTEARALGDGHNAHDSAYDQLRARLLAKQKVERLEDLTVNIRGVVAQSAEKKLTEKMNIYAEKRMTEELHQADLLAGHAWFTPALGAALASRAIAGTDLAHYHRFLRQAEELRYGFVQELNRMHAEDLSYILDKNRNLDKASSQRARIDADNWREALDSFRFQAANVSLRLARAGTPMLILCTWLAALCFALVWAGGRIRP